MKGREYQSPELLIQGCSNQSCGHRGRGLELLGIRWPPGLAQTDGYLLDSLTQAALPPKRITLQLAPWSGMP